MFSELFFYPNCFTNWSSFAMMDEVDIRAIYRYLNTPPPIKNKIVQTVVLRAESPD
jgi:hypothetical protein